MTDPNVEREFLKFQMAATRGYELANKKCEEIDLILQKAERRVKVANADQNPFQVFQNTALTSGQSEKIQQLRTSLEEIQNNLDALHETSKEFSIVIYGHKMAGKSTLMEILTHGNGKTIGKGTKRTVKEVRTYYWHGLKITDISDVDFSCKEVRNALKTANIILFLMTNNASQIEEAGCFAQLKNLGKPILGIINVRKILNFKQRDSILQDLKKILPNNKEIETVISDFKNLASNYNQDWSSIKFLPTHLLSAFYSRMDRVNDEEIYTASNFVEIENLILGKIITHGEFLQIKNFVDSMAFPMYDMFLKMFNYSAISFKESKIWKEQSEEILEWRKKFGDNAQKKINLLFSELSANLRGEIPKFAELHHGTSNVNENWHTKMQDFRCVERYQELLGDILNECKTEFSKLIERLTQELENAMGCKAQAEINVEDRNIFCEESEIFLPDISKLMPNMEWAGRSTNNNTGEMFYQAFFEAQAAAKVAKDSLHEKLSKTSFKVLGDINDRARDIVNKQILGKIDEFSKVADGYSDMLIKFGESQSEIAESLLNEYEGLNSTFFTEAANCKGISDLSGIKVTVRIPGETFGVVAENLEIDTESISKLLNEKFFVMAPQNSWYNTVKKMLGCDFDLDEYLIDAKNEDKTYSVTPKENVSKTKLKLAQQISPYPIIAQ